MKRRIRTLIRHEKWTVVEVPPLKEPDNHWSSYPWINSPENLEDYLRLTKWCEKTFAVGTWTSTLHSFSGTDRPGVRRFVFMDPADATMFRLVWK